MFERRGEPVPKQLVALVPMSIRRPDEQHDLGNRIATLQVPLPIGVSDAKRRLEIVHDETQRLKESEQARAASLVIEATGWTPPTINRVLAGAISRPLTWNLVISNVPGPQMPFYLLGRRVREVYPFVPLSPQGHALSIGVVSFDGGVFFGLTGDRDVIADMDELVDDMDAAVAEQVARAAPTARLLVDRHRRAGRRPVDHRARVAIGGAHASRRGGDAQRPRGAVDGDPVSAEPARRQCRLARREGQRAASVGAVEVPAEGVGHGEAARRRRRARRADRDREGAHDLVPA